jgi:hypothetical protein
MSLNPFAGMNPFAGLDPFSGMGRGPRRRAEFQPLPRPRKRASRTS